MDLTTRWNITFRNSKNDAFHAPLDRQSKALSRLATLLFEIHRAGSPATERCFTELCPLLEYHLLLKSPPQSHHAIDRWVHHFRRIDACFVALTTCRNVDLLSESAWGVAREWAIFFLTAFLSGSDDSSLVEDFVAWPQNAMWRDPEASAPCWYLYGTAVDAIIKHAQSTPELHSVIEDNASFISTECLQLLIDAFTVTPVNYEILEVHMNLLSDIILHHTILQILLEQRAAYWVTKVLALLVRTTHEGIPITRIMASITYRCLRFLDDAISSVGSAVILQPRPSRLFNTLARLHSFSSYDDSVVPSVRDPPGRPSLWFTVNHLFHRMAPFLIYKAIFQPFLAAIANVRRGGWLQDSLGRLLIFAMKMDRLRAEYGNRGKYICWNVQCENNDGSDQTACQKCSRCGVMTFCSTDCQRQHWNTAVGRELCGQLSRKVAEKGGLDTFEEPLSTAERAFLLFVMQKQLESNVSALRQHYLESDPPSAEGVYIDLYAATEACIAFRAFDSKVDAFRTEERLVWMATPWRAQTDQDQDNRAILGVLTLPSPGGTPLIEGISVGRKRHHLLGSWRLDTCSNVQNKHDPDAPDLDTQIVRLEALALS
ncbi:hypothetical protein BDZ89DRAFT_1075724 [Hymenopellis radicata]|nr:hypothetical protein BDZ89DRAFT_1075724 [Hymenopellis radicata]